LIDDLKFDFRIYVLITSVNPLRIYLYEEGLARFATEPYEKANDDNLEQECIHLTNYAINKQYENFVFNTNEDEDNLGHKRSLTAVFATLEEQGVDIVLLWEQIK
jgi:tubulin polyglutamylase TTLL6/13